MNTSLSRLNRTIIAAGIPIDGVAILDATAHTVRIDYQASATPAQKTQGDAIAANFDWSPAADAAWQVTQDRANAIAIFLADTSPSAKVLRGAILALLDQLNIIRAALPAPLAAITVAQAKTAIQNKINGGSVD